MKRVLHPPSYYRQDPIWFRFSFQYKNDVSELRNHASHLGIVHLSDAFLWCIFCSLNTCLSILNIKKKPPTMKGKKATKKPQPLTAFYVTVLGLFLINNYALYE